MTERQFKARDKYSLWDHINAQEKTIDELVRAKVGFIIVWMILTIVCIICVFTLI